MPPLSDLPAAYLAVERERDGLQPEACAAFMELLAMLEVAPWGGKSFREEQAEGQHAHPALR